MVLHAYISNGKYFVEFQLTAIIVFILEAIFMKI